MTDTLVRMESESISKARKELQESHVVWLADNTVDNFTRYRRAKENWITAGLSDRDADGEIIAEVQYDVAHLTQQLCGIQDHLADCPVGDDEVAEWCKELHRVEAELVRAQRILISLSK
jgi:hypothetical protein